MFNEYIKFRMHFQSVIIKQRNKKESFEFFSELVRFSKSCDIFEQKDIDDLIIDCEIFLEKDKFFVKPTREEFLKTVKKGKPISSIFRKRDKEVMPIKKERKKWLEVNL